MKTRAERAEALRPRVEQLLEKGSLRDAEKITGVSVGALRNLLAGSTPQEDTLARLEEWTRRAQPTVREGRVSYDPANLNLPDTRFLHPGAQEVFDATIWNWVRRQWSTETVERAAVLLLGYFNRTSTLLSSGSYVPELSEEMQIHVLRESREEIESAFEDLGGGPKR